MAKGGVTTSGRYGHLFRQLTQEPVVEKDDEEEDKKSEGEPDISLADGMPLPKYLRNDFPDLLLGQLIHEIDPYYEHKNTFVVISTKWVIHRFSSLKSLWLLAPLDLVRWFCIRAVTHWAFRIFMIVTVFAYSIFLHPLMEDMEWHLPFLMLFTIEMILKIMAGGFLLHPFSYLRNPWNWLDFVLTQIGLSLDLHWYFLHPIHSLRILRLIHFFTPSRLMYSWMFRSLRRMRDPLLYGAFMFFMFTIYAQQCFSGALSNRCTRVMWVPIDSLKPHNVTFVSIGPLNHNMTKPLVETLPYVCGNYSGTRACPAGEGYVCKETSQNPDFGYTSFDSFPLAAVSILRLMTRDFWDRLYMQIRSALGPGEFPFILTVIVYGGCYYVNLLLAYIAVGVTELMDILEGKKPKQKKTVAKSSGHRSEDVEASAKERVNNGIEEKDLAHVVDVPLISIDQATNHTNEDEGDTIVLEVATTSGPRDQKHDDDIDDDKSSEYQRRRGPLASFVTPWVDLVCDWNCCSCWRVFSQKLTLVVENIYFNVFIALCITLYVVCESLFHHGMLIEAAAIIDMIAEAMKLVFQIEITLRIIARSPRHYFKSSLNTLDFFVLVSIIFEMIVDFPFFLVLFRLFRVFEILGMKRWWPFLSDLLKITRTNVWSMVIMTAMFAILGHGIFRFNIVDSHDLWHSRWHFLSYHSSLMTVFRILCGEWIEPLWECLPGSRGLYCIPFWFSVLLFGNLVLFTLFVAMLAAALKSNTLTETEPVGDHNLVSIIKNFLTFSWCSRLRQPKRLEEQTASKSREELFDMSADDEAKMSGETQPTFGVDIVSPCWCDACYKFLPCCGSSSAASAAANHTPFWRTWESFRRLSLRLMRNKWLDYGMNTFIFLSCIIQAWNDDRIDGVIFNTISFVTNYFVVIIFTLEILLRISGLGCKKYFTDGWHLFDFIVTVLHLVSMVTTSLIGGFQLPFGFRPLKLIPRLKRLRVVISATLYKLSSLVDVLLACGILWLFFGVFGIHAFGGTFYACKDKEGLLVYSVDNKSHCHSLAENASWQNADYHFDNLGSAFVSLVHVAFLRGWIAIIYSAIDANHPDLQPRPEINFNVFWYFLAFLILGVLCCFTFILATFLRKNNVRRKQISAEFVFAVGGYIEILMTEDQRQEFGRKKGNFFISPVRVWPCPEWWPRRFAYKIVFSSKFKLMVILITTFNAIGLALITLEASHLMAGAIFDIDIVFFAVFSLEIYLRIVAFGRNFFSRSWNIYDFGVLVTSHFVYSLNPLFPHYVPSPLLFGLLRIVRLVRWLKWIRRVASRLMLYLPALNNVALLLLVLIFTYAGIGFILYRHVPAVESEVSLANFMYFGPALISVTQIGFGSSWDGDLDNYKGMRWFTFSFLAFFYLVVLQAAAVLFLEHYHLLDQKRRLGLSDDALETFETAWKILDPDATGYIAYNHLSEFLNAMLPPLRICHPNQDEIAAMDVPIYKDDNVAFNDVLLALLARLDDHGIIDRTEGQNRDDVISSTLKRHQEVEAKSTELDLEEN